MNDGDEKVVIRFKNAVREEQTLIQRLSTEKLSLDYRIVLTRNLNKARRVIEKTVLEN